MEKEAKAKKVLVAGGGEDSRVLVAKLNEKVAELERSEEELRYMGSVLGAIQNIEELIVRERDKTKLLQDACRVLQKVREYRFVWIGLIEEGHKRVVPVAMTGVEGGYLDAVKITWDNQPSGRGPTGTAIKTRKPDMVKNIPENPRTVTWREEAVKRGYRSSAAIPLIHGDKVYGALNVYNTHPDGFSDAEIQLLVGVSGDLAFALKSIEDEEKRQQAEEALKRAGQEKAIILNSLSELVIFQDLNHRIIWTNKAAGESVGMSPQQMVGRYCHEVWGESSEPCPGCPLAKVHQTGQPQASEMTTPDGRMWYVRGYPVRDANGDIPSLVEVVEDVTERRLAEEALRESEEKYRELAESITDLFFAFDKDLRYTYWNKASEELTGFSVEDALGKHLLDIFPASDMTQNAEKMYLKALRTQKVQSFVNEYQLGGRDYFFEISAYPSKDGLSVFVKDITERRLAEEAIQVEKNKLQSVIDAMVDHLTIRDKDYHLIYQSESSQRIFGNHLGEKCYRVYEGQDKLCPGCPVKKAFKDGKPHTSERKTVTPSGEVIFWENTANPIRDAKGEIVSCLEVARNITDRKRAEEKLKESEEKYKTLVEATSDIIWEVDTEGRFTFVSPKIKDILGYEVDEVVGKKRPLDLVAKEEFSEWLKRFKQINAKRKPFSVLEVTHLHKNGRRVIFETSGIPLFDSAGEFKGYVGINRDITERRHMQEQLAITDRLASVGELAAGIAHELNNPLTSVIGFSQLLMDKEVPEDIKQDLQTVYGEAQRASQVVNNLLTFARRHAAVKQMLNINDVINKVLELRAYEQRVENIKVKSLFEPGLPEVMADYFQLQQVFLNIIINAEYFMIKAHNSGKLTITTERVGDIIRASFADDGPGIAKEDLGHIFDPFFTTKEVGKGTGLGLSICHGIMAEHGGRIYVESELGKGTTFIVELPISAAVGR